MGVITIRDNPSTTSVGQVPRGDHGEPHDEDPCVIDALSTMCPGNIMIIRLNYLASVPYPVIGHQGGSEHDDQDTHIEDKS